MSCAYHPDAESTVFCVSCGSALCESCRRNVEGSVYCETCLGDLVRRQVRGRASDADRGDGPGGAGARAIPPRPSLSQPTTVGESPGAAFALGLIPGVGAIYNGDFLKAGVHIVIFGFLISLAEAGGPIQPVLSLAGVGFYFYMPFEAYYTARKRKLLGEGIDLETPIDRFHQQFGEVRHKELWGGIGLVALGLVFLADSFGLLRLDEVRRFWPTVLIAAGVWLVLQRGDRHGIAEPNARPTSAPEGRRPQDHPEGRDV